MPLLEVQSLEKSNKFLQKSSVPLPKEESIMELKKVIKRNTVKKLLEKISEKMHELEIVKHNTTKEAKKEEKESLTIAEEKDKFI